MIDLPSFLFPTEETYSTAQSFEQAVGFVQFIASEHGIDSFEDVLVIQLPDGVFLKTSHPKWSESFKSYTEQYGNKNPLVSIDPRKWQDLTRTYRSPLNSFGNERLAMWKVGF